MVINDIYCEFKYRGLDMGITIQSFEVDDDNNVEIEDYEISLDYAIDTPHQFDHIVLMINSMLADGNHLQGKIFDLISDDDTAMVKTKCLEEWSAYWDDVKADHGLHFDDHFLI